MNRFEALLAPPSLSSTEFGIHLKTSKVPPEMASSCRRELVNVAVRLHDELTTVRFGRTLDVGAAPEEYQEMNFSLTGALATPIEWKFFSREFDALQSAYPGLMSSGQLQRAITELSDPWRVQAWAAQALRIAQNAETEDPKNAASAWGCAAKLYEAFFARADVSQSFTYQQLTDAKAQDMCRAAWQAFLHDEVAALAQRASDYAGRQQAASMAAVLAALAIPGVAAANPEAAARATAAAEESYLTGIRSATSLRAASTMYKNAPRKTADLDRALLEAMVSETKKLGQGFGEVEMVEECGRSLDLDGASLEGGSSLMGAAREEFYQAAVALSRTAINDDQATSKHRKLAIRVLAFVPRDYVAGKDPSGSAITVGNVLDMLKLAESPPSITPRYDPPTVRTSNPPRGLPRALALSRLEDLVDVLLGTRSDSPQQVAAMDDVAEFMVQNPVLTPEDLVTTLDRRHALHNTRKTKPPTVRGRKGFAAPSDKVLGRRGPDSGSLPSAAPTTRRKQVGRKKLAFGLAATLIAVTVAAGALVLSSRGGSTQTAAPAITATETPAAQPATSQDRSTDRPQPKPSKNDPLLMTNVNGDEYGNVVGDCYDDDFNQVDCAMKHYYEFYAFAEIQAHDLPDEGVILESAGDFCGARLIEYVGDSHAGIPTGMHFWWPFDQEEWDNGRRHISCYVESIPPVRGSVRDG